MPKCIICEREFKYSKEEQIMAKAFAKVMPGIFSFVAANGDICPECLVEPPKIKKEKINGTKT